MQKFSLKVLPTTNCEIPSSSEVPRSACQVLQPTKTYFISIIMKLFELFLDLDHKLACD
jgi:hypothetical protein